MARCFDQFGDAFHCPDSEKCNDSKGHQVATDVQRITIAEAWLPSGARLLPSATAKLS